jgi:hypothetical protein
MPWFRVLLDHREPKKSGQGACSKVPVRKRVLCSHERARLFALGLVEGRLEQLHVEMTNYEVIEAMSGRYFLLKRMVKTEKEKRIVGQEKAPPATNAWCL